MMDESLQREFLGKAFAELGRAVDRLDDIVQMPETAYDGVMDATIQRFEFTFEAFWKLFQKLLKHEKGVRLRYPKEVLQEAYALRWIDHEDIWLTMMEDRNKTSHVYQEEKARLIYTHIPRYAGEMHRTYETLRQSFNWELPA